jgi:hypothetical protein
MPRVEDIENQDNIASTLVEPIQQHEIESVPPGGGGLLADLSTDRTDWQSEQEVEESEYSKPADELIDDYIKEQSRDRFELGDEGFEREEQEHPAPPEPGDRQIARDSRGPEVEEQQGPQQPLVEPTAQQIEEAAVVLDRAAEEYGISKDRGVFSSELSELFNLTTHEAGLNAEALEKPLERVFVSSFDDYVANRSDLSKIPPLSDRVAWAWTYSFLDGLGRDPRSIPNLDYRTTANTFRFANMSIFATFEQMGGTTDVRRINNPEVSEGTVNAILQAIGGRPVSREVAVAMADTYARWVLRNVGRVTERRAAAAPERQASRSSAGRGRIPRGMSAGIKGEKAPRFTSNADIFTPGVVAAATTQRI